MLLGCKLVATHEMERGVFGRIGRWMTPPLMDFSLCSQHNLHIDSYLYTVLISFVHRPSPAIPSLDDLLALGQKKKLTGKAQAGLGQRPLVRNLFQSKRRT
jgi:hypothetical protein